MRYEIEYYCTSHVGKIRKNNEDNFFCNGHYMEAENNGTSEVIHGVVDSSENAFFVVFDGMGGEECGEMAAHLAAKTLSDSSFENDMDAFLDAYCQKANQEICNYTKEHQLFSMGSTVALLSFQKKGITLCNIGDSKIFLLSGNELQQISYDHVTASGNGRKALLTQKLGMPEDELTLTPYIAGGEYHNKDIYLICSDGLTDMVPNERIREIIQKSPQDTVCNELLQQALENGGKDNITFIILFIKRKGLFHL